MRTGETLPFDQLQQCWWVLAADSMRARVCVLVCVGECTCNYSLALCAPKGCTNRHHSRRVHNTWKLALARDYGSHECWLISQRICMRAVPWLWRCGVLVLLTFTRETQIQLHHNRAGSQEKARNIVSVAFFFVLSFNAALNTICIWDFFDGFLNEMYIFRWRKLFDLVFPSSFHSCSSNGLQMWIAQLKIVEFNTEPSINSK